MIRTILLLALAPAAHGFAGFLTKNQVGNPALASLAKAPSGTVLDLIMNVGNNENSRMSLQGLHLELCEDEAIDNERVKLPGVDGPHPNVSSGAKKLVVKDQAFFVGMAGRQNVPLHHGCWEMVWRENAPAGVILCGFDLEEAIRRNDASLEKGRIFLSLPVWTKEGLEAQQKRRREVEARVKLHEDAKKEAYEKMDGTSNPIMKALHFRNAAEATEKLSFVDTEIIAQIPMDEDVMALGNGLLVTTEGTVWTKEADNMFGNPQHTLLGTVTIRPTDTPSL